MKTRTVISVALMLSLLLVPVTAFAKKGEKNFRRGLDYETAQQWDKAAQEYTLALAADPSNMEYQLHFRRASFNASQHYMQQGRTLAEKGDFVGAYNAFRQAYGYDPVNELAVSEMERMLRMQNVKEGRTNPEKTSDTPEGTGTPPLTSNGTQPQDFLAPRTEQMRVINFNGDLKAFIRSLAEQLNLNVIFDRTSFAQSRPIDINLRDVTTAQALDYVFLQEGLFFQKLSRRTILVADQSRRAQYQQLVLRTFFLSNMKPSDARTLVQQAIPPSVGRPQTIVVPDDATNSLTVRDTAENVRLIGDLLQSIDKDRAEVVMDVNIYEITKTDLLQLGNQIGDVTNGKTFSIGGSPGFSLLTDNAVQNVGRGVSVASLAGGVPTALAAALVIPPSILTAFAAKGNTKLVASTQVHAFNGEESTARIGQRVPVQTAATYPFSATAQPSPNNNNNFFGAGGFPVINYEPTGLTLKFTPQVFPNLDVQVKMNIESKDVLGANDLVPTFTERTITGTARVQNNRTMMLASVSQDIESHGRRGLPILGGLPFLGRLFTSPTRDNRQVDIVISVTPRVLRAPAITPRDLEMRPSGTLQSPTTGSLEAMIREADRDDQIAAARMLPRNAVVQLPDAPVVPAASQPAPTNTAAAAPAPTTVTPNTNTAAVTPNNTATNTAAVTPNNTATNTAAVTPNNTPTNTAAVTPNNTPTNTAAVTPNNTPTNTIAATQNNTATKPVAPTQNSTATNTVAPTPNNTATNTVAGNTTAPVSAPVNTTRVAQNKTVEELPAFVPAPKSLVSDRAASEVAAVNSSVAGTQSAVLTSLPKSTESLNITSGTTRVARIRFLPSADEMRIGEKRRYAIQLQSDVSLSLALFALRFDPKVVRVHAVSAGDLLASANGSGASLTQSIDPSGICLVSISALNGKTPVKGLGSLIFLDVEAIGLGNASFTFDKDALQVVATDARDVTSQVSQGSAVVKQ